nr:transporter [uncultured Butyrivibrio sp.]
MKNSIQKIVLKMPGILETIVAAILLIAVIYGGFGLILDSIDFAQNNYSLYLENVLKDAFSVIIVIEFVRMLVKHSMKTIVEVLIFTIARGLVVDHENSMQMLLQIIAIAILLICRKHFTNDPE